MQRRARWGGRRTFNSEMTGSIPVRCTTRFNPGVLIGQERCPLKSLPKGYMGSIPIWITIIRMRANCGISIRLDMIQNLAEEKLSTGSSEAER